MDGEYKTMKTVIKKWYDTLGFPTYMQAEFDSLLENAELTPCTIEEYTSDSDYGRNLLMYLYFCENLKEKYAAKGISDDILLHTLSDIVIWATTFYGLYGKVGLEETGWLKNHLSGRLVRLGRLQFCMADGVMEVHIPEGEPLDPEECQKSFERSKTFFAKYFPDFKYDRYTCHSWLLDRTMLKFLKKDSNVEKFMNLFTETHSDKSDAALKYIFKWNTTRETLKDAEPKSTFAAKVKEYVLAGGELFETEGEILI